MGLRRDFVFPATLMAISIVFGGGGSPAPFAELFVQLAALVAVIIWLMLVKRPAGRQDRLVWTGVAALTILPLIQLVPLPPALWHALPGREVERQALALIGSDESWRPISISPYRTISAALSLIPPLTMILFTSRLSSSQRTAMIAAVAALGGCAAVIGMLQVVSGQRSILAFYGAGTDGLALGFQANRNQSVDVILVTMLALLAIAQAWPKLHAHWSGRLVIAACLLFLGMSAVLTGSRAGTVLLVVVAMRALLFLFPGRGDKRSAQLAAGVAALTLLGMMLVASSNEPLSRTWERFHASGDARFSNLWPDAVFAVRQYWPVGSGMGTFVPAFEPAERLEVVDTTNPNRAHNDYLEFTLEAGVGAIASLVLSTVGLIRASMRRLSRSSIEDRAQVMFTLSGGLVLLLHSMVDYPMRSMSLAVIAGMMVGLLIQCDAGVGDRNVSR